MASAIPVKADEMRKMAEAELAESMKAAFLAIADQYDQIAAGIELERSADGSGISLRPRMLQIETI
jgi:hypothetical protein